MKIFVVSGNPGEHLIHHMVSIPYSAHTSRADAEFFNAGNKVLEPTYYGSIKEINLDPKIHKDVIDKLIQNGVIIPEHLKEKD